nr:hypothetical protein [Tanacetum cinerariifolium]
MLLLIAQNKLFNLEGDVIVDFATALKMVTQRIVMHNRVEDVQLGVESYQRNLNLTKPQRTCLHISAKEPYTPNFDPPRNFRLGYNTDMSTREYTTKDKRRTDIMLNKIDDQMFKRRQLRSLEVLVGGRKPETNKRLLYRTI